MYIVDPLAHDQETKASLIVLITATHKLGHVGQNALDLLRKTLIQTTNNDELFVEPIRKCFEQFLGNIERVQCTLSRCSHIFVAEREHVMILPKKL